MTRGSCVFLTRELHLGHGNLSIEAIPGSQSYPHTLGSLAFALYDWIDYGVVCYVTATVMCHVKKLRVPVDQRYYCTIKKHTRCGRDDVSDLSEEQPRYVIIDFDQIH